MIERPRILSDVIWRTELCYRRFMRPVSKLLDAVMPTAVI